MYGESVSDMLLGNGALIVMCTGMRIVRLESDLVGLSWEGNYVLKAFCRLRYENERYCLLLVIESP